jgi:Ino eighty subunit 2
VVDVIEDRMPDAEKDGDALPTMYRWVSTTRAPASSADAVKAEAEGMVMSISFSVPASVPMPLEMPAPEKPKVLAPALCGVAGCGKHRRYRLVGGEWGTGACGMVHLKILEGR